MTTATAPAITREILEDRYEGLILDVHDGDFGERTKLHLKLSNALGILAQRTARCHRDDVSQIQDELYPIVREYIIRRIVELDLARA